MDKQTTGAHRFGGNNCAGANSCQRSDGDDRRGRPTPMQQLDTCLELTPSIMPAGHQWRSHEIDR